MELTTKELQLIEMVFDRINKYGGFANDGKELLEKIKGELSQREYVTH
jgi:hypothetical protein